MTFWPDVRIVDLVFKIPLASRLIAAIVRVSIELCVMLRFLLHISDSVILYRRRIVWCPGQQPGRSWCATLVWYLTAAKIPPSFSLLPFIFKPHAKAERFVFGLWFMFGPGSIFPAHTPRDYVGAALTKVGRVNFNTLASTRRKYRSFY